MIVSEVIILGGGIAGVSLAAALARHVSITLIEVEEHLGRHATGRSAAVFFESYGNASVRALTRASKSFFTAPPVNFASGPLVHPRSAMHVACHRRTKALDRLAAELGDAAFDRLSADEACRLVPILSERWLGGAVLDRTGYDVDVDTLLQGYARLARAGGAIFVTGAKCVDISRENGAWTVKTHKGLFESAIIVNAAGAWADVVAVSAGLEPLNLTPLRRSALIIPAPAGHDIRTWPLVLDIDEEFYFKPDAGQLLLSPANEDPELPGDSAPEELDIALAIDRYERATIMSVTQVSHRWSGLRTFAPDRTPVVGFDDTTEGFFWLAGQGGYGVQTAPAMAAVASALIMGQGRGHISDALAGIIPFLAPRRSYATAP